MDTLLAVLRITALAVAAAAFGYPAARYLAVRLYLRVRLLCGPGGGFCIALRPFPTLLPGLWSHSPDLAYYLNGDLYLFKFYAFRRRRKALCFGTPYRWTVKNFYPSLEDNATFAYREGGFADRLISLPHTVKAPMKMTRAAGVLTASAAEYGVDNVIPCLFFAPSVKKLTNAAGLKLEAGDITYFGSLIVTPGYLETLFNKKSSRRLPLSKRLAIRRECLKAVYGSESRKKNGGGEL